MAALVIYFSLPHPILKVESNSSNRYHKKIEFIVYIKFNFKVIGNFKIAKTQWNVLHFYLLTFIICTKVFTNFFYDFFKGTE